MIRTLTAQVFNRIANHPEVRPFLGGTNPLDFTNFLANPENFGFLTDDGKGGYLYHKTASGQYFVHTLSVPEGRGREMLLLRSQGLREIFTKTDALEVVTLVPDGNKGADVWAAHAGFREVFRRERSFDLMGEKVGASYRSLAYVDWALKDKGCRHDGAMFHEQIHRYVTDDHGEDAAHDAMVGATLECLAQRNAEKGLSLYNRWANHAGYLPIKVLTLNPLVLDIGSCIIQNDADGSHVLYVRAATRSVPSPSDEDLRCQQQPSAQPQA